MTSHEELDVATATHNVLSNIGCDALQPASRFLSCLWNDMDHNSSEWHVLELNCDDEMLAPFVEELRTTAPNLHLAAGRVRVILTQQRMVSEAFALPVANGIAAGLARWKHGYPYSVTAASMTLPLGGDDKDPLSLSATT